MIYVRSIELAVLYEAALEAALSFPPVPQRYKCITQADQMLDPLLDKPALILSKPLTSQQLLARRRQGKKARHQVNSDALDPGQRSQVVEEDREVATQ